MRSFRTALLALLATEAVASSFIEQAIASGQLKPSNSHPNSKSDASLAATGDSPDYHCRKDKPCALGCCGPL